VSEGLPQGTLQLVSSDSVVTDAEPPTPVSTVTTAYGCYMARGLHAVTTPATANGGAEGKSCCVDAVFSDMHGACHLMLPQLLMIVAALTTTAVCLSSLIGWASWSPHAAAAAPAAAANLAAVTSAAAQHTPSAAVDRLAAPCAGVCGHHSVLLCSRALALTLSSNSDREQQ
jgi:hypothetical protein